MRETCVITCTEFEAEDVRPFIFYHEVGHAFMAMYLGFDNVRSIFTNSMDNPVESFKGRCEHSHLSDVILDKMMFSLVSLGGVAASFLYSEHILENSYSSDFRNFFANFPFRAGYQLVDRLVGWPEGDPESFEDFTILYHSVVNEALLNSTDSNKIELFKRCLFLCWSVLPDFNKQVEDLFKLFLQCQLLPLFHFDLRRNHLPRNQ